MLFGRGGYKGELAKIQAMSDPGGHPICVNASLVYICDEEGQEH